MAYEMSALSVPSPLAVRKDTSLTGGNTSPLSARDPLPPDLDPASVPDTLLGVGGKHTGEVISPVIPRAPQTLSRRHVRIRNMQVGKISREKPRPTESLIRNSWEISRSEMFRNNALLGVPRSLFETRGWATTTSSPGMRVVVSPSRQHVGMFRNIMNAESNLRNPGIAVDAEIPAPVRQYVSAPVRQCAGVGRQADEGNVLAP